MYLKERFRLMSSVNSVGSLGLPEEIKAKSPSTQSLFGFSNTDLGCRSYLAFGSSPPLTWMYSAHIAFAYQALALDETRKDFLPVNINISYISDHNVD